VRWQRRAPGETAWSDIDGATSGTLSVDATADVSGTRYRAVFESAAGHRERAGHAVGERRPAARPAGHAAAARHRRRIHRAHAQATLRSGRRGTIRIALPRAAVEVLAGRRAKVRFRVTVRSGAERETGVVRVTLRRR
jgi:hypothetical protein